MEFSGRGPGGHHPPTGQDDIEAAARQLHVPPRPGRGYSTTAPTGRTVSPLARPGAEQDVTVFRCRDSGSGTHSVNVVDEFLLIGRLERCG